MLNFKRSWQSILLNTVLRIFVKWPGRTDISPIKVRNKTIKVFNKFGGQHSDPNVNRSNVEISGRSACVFELKKQNSKKIILYLHGGGFYMPALNVHYEFLEKLCVALNCSAVMPDYRLAPEHPFPAGANDCLASYQWCLDQGYAPKDIVIAGDSAGGNLCLATLVSARDAQLPMPSCAFLLSPASDSTFSGSSLYKNAKRDPVFTVPQLFWMRDYYLSGDDVLDSRASPLFASFEKLPPLLFHVGSTELLLDGSVLAHEKATNQGVDSKLFVYPKMPHVFPLLSQLPEARKATRQIIDFIQTHSS